MKTRWLLSLRTAGTHEDQKPRPRIAACVLASVGGQLATGAGPPKGLGV